MENKSSIISSCEVCGSQVLRPVLNLGLHPMCDDLIPVGNSSVTPQYPIEILFCEKCLTAHQKFQVPKHDLFPSSYHYRSRFTADVLSGMTELVKSCENRFDGVEKKRVLDIGCNDGSLLDFFAEKGAVTFGIEPTDAYEDAIKKGHTVLNDYLSLVVANDFVTTHGKPDFITFTNVFAHIENLNEVLDSLKVLMGPNTIIIIENHYLGAVLNKKQFDTFYHEHPRTYSYTSFKFMAQSLSLDLLDVEFPSRYGGNIRVFMGKESAATSGENSTLRNVEDEEKNFINVFLEMSSDVESWMKSKKIQIQELVSQHGKIKAKAFPGRAAILVKLLGLNEQTISAVYEKPGSLKIGHYLPGTRIPIRSDEELFNSPETSAPILNLAWHIPGEIKSYLKANGYRGEVVDILEPRDFLKS